MSDIEPAKQEGVEHVYPATPPTEEDVSKEDVVAHEVLPQDIPFFRSTRFQALALAAAFFCGPGMYSAMNTLGAGGLESPTLVNITTGYSFGMNAIFAFFSGAIINKVGIRFSLSTGLLGFSIFSAALYCNNLYGTTWLLYFSSVIQGYLAAVLWVVQGAIMLAYPEPEFRGRMIAMWYSAIWLGQAVGGAISLGFNARTSGAGAVSSVTYIPIITIACLGPFIALLLSPPSKVIRRDGLPVRTRKLAGPWAEVKSIFSALKRREIVILIPLFIYSQWFNGYESTFVATYHSVRGRALGSFVSAITGILGCFTTGLLLDKGSAPRSKKFRRAYFFIYAIYTSSWIWATVLQWWYQKTDPVGLDWTQGEFYASFLLFLLWRYIDTTFQTFMYALVGTLSDEVEAQFRYVGILKCINTAGAALGYGVQVKWSMMGAESVILVLWVAQIIPTWFVVRDVSD